MVKRVKRVKRVYSFFFVEVVFFFGKESKKGMVKRVKRVKRVWSFFFRRGVVKGYG